MTGEETAIDRTTKYVAAVREYMHHAGHATNAEILAALRAQYPTLSATTVHRVTARLMDHGELQLAPSGRDGAMRYDINIMPHDHFMCEHCGLLRDAHLDVTRPLLEDAIGGGCAISGSLTVSGLCRACHKEVR